MAGRLVLIFAVVGCAVISYHGVASGQEAHAALKTGDRVVRGRDWDPRTMYDRVTPLGTVRKIFDSERSVKVRWDCGTVNTYRYGKDGKYEVQLALSPGDRVVRGPHWNKGDEDGNTVGVVTGSQPLQNRGLFHIRWSNGREGSYRFGPQGQFQVQRYVQSGGGGGNFDDYDLDNNSGNSR